MVAITGKATGTRRNPTITLTMPRADGEKLMFLCRFVDVIAESMEFIGMKYKPVVHLMNALKVGLLEAGVKGD